MTTPARIPLAKPSITELEVRYAGDAAANGWGEHCYDYLARFEAGFAAHMGAGFAIATSSCTGALHMGMAALGIGPGDEVILADTNWIATMAPIVQLGAKSVLVDICPDTWCVSAEAVAKAITPATKAIVATHIYGNLCDIDSLQALADQHGIALIEDAAEAIGSTYKGRAAGSMGLFSGFSFHGSKTMTTGEGGMFFTKSEALYEKVLTLSNHGRSRHQPKQFWPEVVGYKYKMSNIQAALGCAQLERVQALVERRREILHLYQERLCGLPGISMNPELAGTRVGAWMPTVVFGVSTGVLAADAIAVFQQQNIDARVFFHPLSSLPMFEGQAHNTRNPHASDIARRAINLPSFHDITLPEIERVAQVVRSAVHG
jgi:perosamine synthetase